MIKKFWLPFMCLLSASLNGLNAQVFNLPAVGLKSHQTMEVVKVERSATAVTVFLSVENRIRGGTFCADPDIWLIHPDGSRIKIAKAVGIPVCPDSYKFKNVGEVLEFSLVFQPVQPAAGWIDIVEDCSQDCFSIYGILLNDGFSRRIDEAVSHVNKGHVDSAIGAYTKLIQEASENEAGITGSLYSDLISLLEGKRYTANAAEWYRKLASSKIPRKEFYIENLNFRGIKY